MAKRHGHALKDFGVGCALGAFIEGIGEPD
jgi:hypothetical protein